MGLLQKSNLAALKAGDTIRLVSPASTPRQADVENCIRYLEGLGFKAQLGRHALDREGYLAGADEFRLSDLNDAIRDSTVKAIIATAGGKGAYRIADDMDFAAMCENPKPLIGFSEITILHLAIWQRCKVPGIHGAAWSPAEAGETSSNSFERAISTSEPIVVHTDGAVLTAGLTSSGKVEGVLLGGNLDMIGTAAGWALPNLNGAILLMEDIDKGLGHIDRVLTRLIKTGCLKGILGVAVGQFSNSTKPNDLAVIEVLRDRLSLLGVPILGGLPLGHGKNALAIPLGTQATLDADNQTLRIESAFA